MQETDNLLRRLIEYRVKFVIVGGFAAVAHGVSLMTQDIDIACRFSIANLMKLQAALSTLHPVHRLTSARLPLRLTPARCRSMKNLYLSTDWGQLDCLGAVLGIGSYPEVYKLSIEVDLGFGRCRLLTLDALIKAKAAMGRPRDLEAIRQLEAIRERLC